MSWQQEGGGDKRTDFHAPFSVDDYGVGADIAVDDELVVQMREPFARLCIK
jgi:hypothetical protein